MTVVIGNVVDIGFFELQEENLRNSASGFYTAKFGASSCGQRPFVL
jgi:hypothetical protein